MRRAALVWAHAGLKSHREFLAANRYGDLKVPSQPAVRSTILGRPMEIEQTTAAAITGITPTEEQEWYGLIGRGERMSVPDYRANQLTRSLRDSGPILGVAVFRGR
jgi:hypothetical protein